MRLNDREIKNVYIVLSPRLRGDRGQRTDDVAWFLSENQTVGKTEEDSLLRKSLLLSDSFRNGSRTRAGYIARQQNDSYIRLDNPNGSYGRFNVLWVPGFRSASGKGTYEIDPLEEMHRADAKAPALFLFMLGLYLLLYT